MKGAVITYFNVLYQQQHGRAEENHEKSQSGKLVASL
jgi:hypothetical protein